MYNRSRVPNRANRCNIRWRLIGFTLVLALSAAPELFSNQVTKNSENVLELADNPSVPKVSSESANTVELSGSEELDQLTKQLVERVNDSCFYLQALILLVTVVVTVVSIGLGVSIWQTKKYAKFLLDIEYGGFENKLKSLVETNNRDLEDSCNANMVNLLDAFRETWNYLSTAMKELDEAEVAAIDLKDEDKQGVVEERAKKREHKYMFAHQCVCLKLAGDVVNAAQQLGAMGDPAAIPYLDKALNRWRSDPKAKIAIQRAIDKIKKNLPVLSSASGSVASGGSSIVG